MKTKNTNQEKCDIDRHSHSYKSIYKFFSSFLLSCCFLFMLSITTTKTYGKDLDPLTNERPIKLLVLIVASSDRPLYTELEKLWRSYMHLDPEHVEAYFLKADPTLLTDHQIIGDVCWSKCEGSLIPGVLRKTLLSMEAFSPRIMKEFDYVLRTNLSSVYHFPRLLSFLKQLPPNRCYYGYVHYISKALIDLEHLPAASDFSLAEGSGFIISPDVVSLLIEHKNELWNKTWQCDDIILGEFLHRHGIYAQSSPRMCFTLDGDWERYSHLIPPNMFSFRVKYEQYGLENNEIVNKARWEHDLPIHRQLIEEFYGINPLLTSESLTKSN